jgi:hypothetical protein
MCLRRRDEDSLHHHRLPSGRSDSQTPAQSGVPRPGPVRAARATAGRRQFLAMISNEGRWSFRTISLPSSDAPCVSVCESGAPNFARICWGERIFQREGSWNLLSARRTRFHCPTSFSPLRWPLETFPCARDRMSYSFGHGRAFCAPALHGAVPQEPMRSTTPTASPSHTSNTITPATPNPFSSSCWPPSIRRR